MKRRYYVQKTEMIEVDEPIFEKLADDPLSCSTEDFEEAIARIEAITGEKVCGGIEDWEEGITDVYTEDGIKVFGMP